MTQLVSTLGSGIALGLTEAWRERAGSFRAVMQRNRKEPPMNGAFLAIALASQLGSPLIIPVGDVVPFINVERICKYTTAANLDLAQSVENCMRDESAARLQLIAIWSTYSASTRDRCEKESTIPGTGANYVDMLTCMQMADPSNLSPTGLRGASKNRNKN
jgi:hypothetical protein